MVERDTGQVAATDGHSDESALWYLNKYAELSGVKKRLSMGHRSTVFEKIEKDLGKIVTAKDNIGNNIEESETHATFAPKTILEAGRFRLFWEESLAVKPNGEKVKLSFKESNVLYLLMSRPGRVVRYKEFGRVWPNADMKKLKIYTRLYVHYLREKLGDTCLNKPGKRRSEWNIIKTIERKGYMCGQRVSGTQNIC